MRMQRPTQGETQCFLASQQQLMLDNEIDPSQCIWQDKKPISAIGKTEPF